MPPTLHDEMKARAAMMGMSLPDYLRSEFRPLAVRPTLDELRTRLERRSAINPAVGPAEAVRAERGD